MDLTSLGMKAIHEFDDIRQSPLPQERLNIARKQALAFRERFIDEPCVQFYQSADMVRVPYPTWYAYSGVYTQSTYKFPYLHILNRLFIVQFRNFLGELKTLLFSPSDIDADRETPFFKRLTNKMPNWSPLENMVAPITRDVTQALAEVGLAPEDIDYISYDHLHTQDVRQWLGTTADTTDPLTFPMPSYWYTKKNGLAPQPYCPCRRSGIALMVSTALILPKSLSLLAAFSWAKAWR